MDLLPRISTVVGAWIVSSYLSNDFEEFPYLIVSSPYLGCGKTRLMKLISRLVFRQDGGDHRIKYGIRQSHIYGLADGMNDPDGRLSTLILDEAEALNKYPNTELSELIRGAVEKDSAVCRYNQDESGTRIMQTHSLYYPKVFGMIGTPEARLGDRSVIVYLRRTEAGEKYQRLVGGEFQGTVSALREKIERWRIANREAVTADYQNRGYPLLKIRNPRMQKFYLPLQLVCRTASSLATLTAFCQERDGFEHDTELPDPLKALMIACQESLADYESEEGDKPETVRSEALVELLKKRKLAYTAKKLAMELKKFGIFSRRVDKASKKNWGYSVPDFFRSEAAETAEVAETPRKSV